MMLKRFYTEWISPQRWLERLGVRAPMQIAVGLVLLMTCVCLLARDLKLLPHLDGDEPTRRAQLAEFAASAATSTLTDEDNSTTDKLLSSLVKNDDSVRSACLRRADGMVIAATPHHDEYWRAAQASTGEATHIRAAIFSGPTMWGQLEMAFVPLPGSVSWKAWLNTRSVRLVAFLVCTTLILFWIFLSRMLTMLDPVGVVPDRMQVMMDTLVEGIAIVDNQGRIVMTNQAFAQTAFASTSQLVGRDLSSLPWLAHDGDSRPAFYPWAPAERSDLRQRGVPIRLQIGTRHARRLNVNSSPIMAPDQTVLGMIVTFDDQTTLEIDNFQLSHLVSRFGNALANIRRLQAQSERAASEESLAQLNDLALAASELMEVCRAATVQGGDAPAPACPSADVPGIRRNAPQSPHAVIVPGD